MATLQVPPVGGQRSFLAMKAAQAAASSPHALTNLIRLVKSLEIKVAEEDDEPSGVHIIKRDWETVSYARETLEALRTGNEQSSSTASIIEDLGRSLDFIESAYRVRASSPSPTPSINPALIALPMSPSPTGPILSHLTILSPPLAATPHSSQLPSEPRPEPQSVRRRRAQVDDYLTRRSREDTIGGDTFMLPLKIDVKSKPGKVGSGARESLLDGIAPGSGLGSSQLHEELSGQLANMSLRLKQNAIHFANSLENEKHLIQESQDSLESNLTATRSNKKQLSAVSKKGRGTTCMTFGIVIVVMMVFIWTAMLIRFT